MSGDAQINIYKSTLPTLVNNEQHQALVDENGRALVNVGGVSGPVSTASPSVVASAATSAQLLAATATRKGMILYNSDANALLLKYGTTASASSFTVRIPGGALWEMPGPIYTGRIDGIWEADGSGSAFITEL